MQEIKRYSCFSNTHHEVIPLFADTDKFALILELIVALAAPNNFLDLTNAGFREFWVTYSATLQLIISELESILLLGFLVYATRVTPLHVFNWRLVQVIFDMMERVLRNICHAKVCMLPNLSFLRLVFPDDALH